MITLLILLGIIATGAVLSTPSDAAGAKAIADAKTQERSL